MRQQILSTSSLQVREKLIIVIDFDLNHFLTSFSAQVHLEYLESIATCQRRSYSLYSQRYCRHLHCAAAEEGEKCCEGEEQRTEVARNYYSCDDCICVHGILPSL